MSPFNGHTRRQHHRTSVKGGKARMRSIAPDQQREWGRRGGLASQARLRRIRDSAEVQGQSLAEEASDAITPNRGDYRGSMVPDRHGDALAHRVDE